MPQILLPTYRLHGLCLRSEVELYAAADEGARPDFTIRWGDSAKVPNRPPDGFLLARILFARGGGFAHVRTETGYTLRFPRICEFQVDCEQRSMAVHLERGIKPDVASLLLAGNVAAFLLNLAGECVLHASAVEIHGAALAFVGRPGSGKSTLAAAFCAAGARLVTDDVLRLKFERTGCRCFSGTLELRLRSSASEVSRHFPDAAQRPTIDQRIAVRPNKTEGRKKERPPLRAILIPRLTRASTALRVERLSRPKALFNLTRCPSMFGWQVDEPIRRQFHSLARAADSVPTYELTIPLGQPYSSRVPEALLRRLD